jgi:diguanylate cyclase (GGDEF)-like protein/PAS domain S-box-containing protein
MSILTGARRRWALRSFDHLRPGARAVVLTAALVIVLASSLVTAELVSRDVTATAVNEALRTAETLVRGDADPSFVASAIADPDSVAGQQVNDRLARLVSSGGFLRIKIWGPDGTVIFSDLPALRGQSFALSDELREALDGRTATEVTPPDADENVFERGLAAEVLELYLPVQSNGRVVGVYEVYENAAPVLAAVEETRRHVIVVAAIVAAAILGLLYLAFAGTWARLMRTNRSLRGLTQDVRRSEARFRSLVQNSRDVVTVADRNGVVVYHSTPSAEPLGIAGGEQGDRLLESVHPDDAAFARGVFRDVVATPRGQRELEVRVRSADGSWRTVEATLTNLLDDPGVGGIVVNSRDISERRALEDQLRHQALHDPLTGLANRALFADRLEHALERHRGHGEGVAVLLIDLDDFKTVNDGLGHAVGDQLLINVAERLRSQARPEDTVARMGGDEFAVLLEAPVSAAAPRTLARRLLTALREPVGVSGRSVAVHASIGIAWNGSSRGRASDLVRDADVAMYAAKRRGKDRFEVFEHGMQEAALARLELTNDLDRALDAGELALHYQPVVDLRDGRIVSVEALVRWNHPSRGLLLPESFIGLAEDTGQIVPLGRWVVDEACRQAAEWGQRIGRDVPVAVNLSVRELQDRDVVAHVRAALTRHRTPPGLLTVEVTESVWLEEMDQSQRALRELRDLGVHLAIDDFGTGYSSLGYLRRFPFDALKIDRSFVSALEGKGEGVPLVRSIIDLGTELGRSVVAEGIERRHELDTLRRLGCVYGQGRLLAPPLPSDRLEAVLVAGAVTIERPGRTTNGNGHAKRGGANGSRSPQVEALVD